MCYRDNVPPVDFSGIHVASLSGDNGAGKSTLLDAITWALWGQARAKSDDDLIHIGQTWMEVEYDFCAGSDKYRVIRKRSRSKTGATVKSILELQQKSGDEYRSITENSIKETERKIIEILQMDYTTFINSAYLVQGRADEFTVKGPSERKKVLSEILGLSFYDELERRARQKALELKNTLSTLQAAMEEIDRELKGRDSCQHAVDQISETLVSVNAAVTSKDAEFNILRDRRKETEGSQRELDDIKRRLKLAEDQLRDGESQVKDNRQEVAGYEKVLSEYQARSDSINSDLSKLSESESGLTPKKERQQELLDLVNQLKSDNVRLREEMGELKSKIKILNTDGANCPLCGSTLGAEGHGNIVDKYKSEGKDKGDQFRNNEGSIRQAESERDDLTREVGEKESQFRRERSSFEQRRSDLRREKAEAEEKRPKVNKKLAGIRELIVKLRANLDKDMKRKQELSDELTELPQIVQDLSNAEKLLKESKTEKEKLDRDLAVNQERLRSLDKKKVLRRKKSDSWRQASENKDVYDELAAAFGRKGIQALIIESALPEIEQETHELLGRMTDNRMNIRLESQRAKKKGDEVVETLDIMISDELGTRNYEMYSGGEAFRINFALRIALSKLLARRHGTPLSTLIIDEGFGTQDNAGKEKIVEAINSIQDDFEKIIVITHIEEMKDAFETRIQVTKTDEGSTVEVANF
jgi:exonuclease SbcC